MAEEEEDSEGFPFLFGVYTILYGLLILYYLLWSGAGRGRLLIGKFVQGYLRRRWHDELLEFSIGKGPSKTMSNTGF